MCCITKDALRKASNETITALRKRGISLLEKGHTKQAIADILKIGLSTLQSWIEAYKEVGSNNKPPSIILK